ncbi:MAG: IPT/TIG domain-containing protein, partial [Hymenobacteraceae bacterium]|nr:IPT/TIG domain-containing protein [Hymenobacteraceae bacterium]
TLASTGSVRVRTNNGQATASGTFTVEGAPIVSSFSPGFGRVGDVVTISGRNFTGATYVYIGNGSVASKEFVSVSDTEIKVKVPTLASTGSVRVRSDNGQGYGVGTFTVESATTISTFSPTSGPLGTEVTILGQGFTGATYVYIGSGYTTPTTGFRIVSDTEIRVVVPATATTGKLRIRTSGGQVYSTATYTVTSATITINPVSLSFTDVPAGTSEIKQYEVSGLGLANGAKVSLNVSDNTSPFTISTSAGSGFGKSVELSGVANNKLAPTIIYVRYAPQAIGTNQESILHSQGTTSNRLTINATAAAPLPVELISFKAETQQNSIQLKWKTASETDNSHFEVEVAQDLKNGFTKVGEVKSKVTNSVLTTSYTYTHNYNGSAATLYYRLKQVDLDGTYAYSKVVSVEPMVKSLQQEMIVVAPNPLVYNSKVFITAESSGKAVLRLSSMAGKQVYFREIDVEQGQTTLQLPLYDQLQKGLYVLMVELNGERYTVKVVKQ